VIFVRGVWRYIGAVAPESNATVGDVGGQSPAPARPLLIFDGDCGFCRYWAEYWRKLTGDRVDYRPYQEVGDQFTDITPAEFQRAVQYIPQSGPRASGAEASFLTLSHAHGKALWLALYRWVPGFAGISELAYSFIAAHRPAFHSISLLLWGRDYSPPQHDLIWSAFARLLGVIYLFAFASFGVQALGLIGNHGILPLADLVSDLSARFGAERFFLMPMVFWWNSTDLAIETVCWGGAALSLLLVFNRLTRSALLALYILYLSLLYAGQEFMTYQWDTFLLETGFVAYLMSVWRPVGMWLLRWLLFRFMFMSGAVKLLSGDPTWWDLSALSYHFLTQPLPTPLAWSAAHLNPSMLKFATGATFFVELVLPFLIFFPRRVRFVAAFGILTLQSCILITGNYNWFNLQTMLLCLVLFDDDALKAILPKRVTDLLSRRIQGPAPVRTVRIAVGTVAAGIVFSSLVQMDARFGGNPPAAADWVAALVEPAHIVNGYGLFAVMTTKREEIVIEGSDDGVEWREYEFRYKPGDLSRRPLWNIPHQPRLDWQMWFAALDDPRHLRWFWRFLQKLLENDPAVTRLLEKNPFPDKRPDYVRAVFYDYTFSDADKKAKGIWWNRRRLGLYFPAAQLKSE
jgi:predicted DCC family thiol-disulfide oxidoreductase YuxK